MSTRDETPFVTRIPADVDRPDEIVFGLTARQGAIVAAAGVLLWLAYTATNSVVPPMVFAAAAVPMAGAVAALVLVRRDGLGLDQLALAAVRHRLSPRRLVPAGQQVAPAPQWVNAKAGPLPAPLRLPPQAISTTGVVDLGTDGVAVLCACSTVNFALRTNAEQHALVGAFARWLNSLTGPVQVVVRADRLDPTPLIARLHADAPGLPHPALEHAALDHAGFLAEMAAGRDLLHRHVLLVFTEPRPARGGGAEAAGRRALRRAEEAAAALRAAEITVAVLDGPAVAAVLSAAADPHRPPPVAGLAPPGAVITGPDIPGWRP